jgi:hypothetical protein
MAKSYTIMKSHRPITIEQTSIYGIHRNFVRFFWLISSTDPSLRLVILQSPVLWLFFWTRLYLPLGPKTGYRPPLHLRPVWKSRFWYFYKKCFFDPGSMFIWAQKHMIDHRWTFARCKKRHFDVFIRNIFFTFDPDTNTHTHKLFFFIWSSL